MRKLLPFLGAVLLLVVVAFSPPQGVIVSRVLTTNDSITDTLLGRPPAGLYRASVTITLTDSDTVVADTAFARNIRAGIICKTVGSVTYAQNTDTIPTGVAAHHSYAGRQKSTTALCFAQDTAILYRVTKTTATGKIPYSAYFLLERVR